MKKGSEFDSPLKTAHLCFLRGVLGVKRSAQTGLCYKSVSRSLCSFIDMVPCCCQVFLNKIVHAGFALGASYKK